MREIEEVDPQHALRGLETDSPAEDRRQALRILCKISRADAGLFCRYGRSNGELHLMNVEVFADERLATALQAVRGDEAVARSFPDPRDPPRDNVGSFVTSEVDGSLVGSRRLQRLQAALYRPAGVEYVASTLLYEESRFLGWIALLRTGDEPFGRDVVGQLDGLVPQLVRVFADADRTDFALLGECPAHLVVQPSSWKIEQTTENAQSWLTERRRDDLADQFEDVTSDGGFPARRYFDGFEVWMNELEGVEGMRYLAMVEKAEYTELAPDSVMTPRQREVVGYAAAGATNREIAQTLDISPETVSDHLSDAYSRLGVANRVELALTLNGVE